MTDRDESPTRAQIEARLDTLEFELSRLAVELSAIRELVAERPTAPTLPPLPEPTPTYAPVAPAPPEPAPERPIAHPLPRAVLAPTTGAAPAPTGATPTAPGPEGPTAPPRPPRRTIGELARDWDLVGARGFAIAGGAVMALGISLFFILAANRGWINEETRVALGATASALVFGAGLLLRARHGQYWSALAAVGAGIAGAYATLAAATARYDLLPDGLALPLAGLIAAIGTVVAVRWRSQVIAAIGLLGAALAPALQAIDTELTWVSAGFAVIILVAVAVVSVPRRWRELLIAGSVIVGLQAQWLVAEAGTPAGAGTIAVASAFALCLLGVSIGLQLVRVGANLDPAALTYAVVAAGAALFFSSELFGERLDRGSALLAGAAVWAVVFAVLQWRRLPDLGLVVGVSALVLAAVGSADLLSDAGLTIAWAGEGVLFAALARRLSDARLQATGIVYAALAAASALVTDARPALFFDEGADQLAAVLPLAAAAVAAIAAGVLRPDRYVRRTESGLLAFVAALRADLHRHRDGLREALLFAAAALATLSAAFLLVSASFEWGHVASSFLAAAVAAVALAVSGVVRSKGLALASYVWLGVVLVEALSFDVWKFYDDETSVSNGGWSLIGAAAGILGGAYAHRLLERRWQAGLVLAAVAAGVAAAAGDLGIGLVTQSTRAGGLAVALAAVLYVGLAAGVFRRLGCRNFSTTLWSLGLILLIEAESLLITDSVWRAVAIAMTAFVVGALARPLLEMRLWLAGGSLAVVTSAVVEVGLVQPWLGEGELDLRLALASGTCALASFGLSALVWREPRWRDLDTVLWAVGILSLLATERVVLDDWRATAFAVALTGGVVALLARPLREPRLWGAGLILVGAMTFVTVALVTTPSHFFVASENPADGLWVLLGCLLGLAALAASGPVEEEPDVPFQEPPARYASRVLVAVTGGIALFALSLGILEIAERVSTASISTDFERGHTAVSGLWALVGLALLVIGLLRRSPALRYGGLALFGLALAKIFLYDLAELSSVARAFSFILVGGLLLAGGFFLQRLSDRIGPRHSEPPQPTRP